MATILIIEDEPALLILAESVLQHAGYETLTAGTLAQAQAIIGSDQTFDAVITDIVLADEREGGVQVGQLVRQRAPETPVLYTSGAQVTDGMKAMLVWPYAFLPKPYTDHQLIETLSRLLRKKGER